MVCQSFIKSVYATVLRVHVIKILNSSREEICEKTMRRFDIPKIKCIFLDPFHNVVLTV